MYDEDQSPPNANRHPRYWFEDGSVIVQASDKQERATAFKLHNGLLRRHSGYFSGLHLERSSGVVTISSNLGVQLEDFISLLEHLYHDSPLSSKATFPHVAAVLRVSSPSQLDFPSIHDLARGYLEAMFPSSPLPFVHPNRHLEEALALAAQYRITSIEKGLYYSLVTTTEFESDAVVTEATEDVGSDCAVGQDGDIGHPHPSTVRHVLPSADVEKCRRLMTGLVDHFTPILFTPPTTPHMPCTDVFADKWMPLVVQYAISCNGIHTPLETLERIKQIDWAAGGLCPACVKEKKEEWTQEQVEVWERVDGWLATPSNVK
ncbi:hypothetical protein ID866_9181 [Astraeus odoratus]|nr:hypothetical protein ID866_9181 [Astraeus odoratus]